MSSSSSAVELNRESIASWETNAGFWDESVGVDGNKYWKSLQLPALERMVDVESGEEKTIRALDLATGNGIVARWLASRRGASVLATDCSDGMLKRARERQPAELEGMIDYRRLDVTDEEDLEAFVHEHTKNGKFDVVVINMAMMDISNIEPLANALPKLLTKDGIFFATVLHPVFWTSGATRSIEVEDSIVSGVGSRFIRGKVVREYLDVAPARGIAMPGQPVQQVYFHRPIHELLSTFFKAGMVMDRMEEPAFSKEDGIPHRPESHMNYTQLPAILAFRLRRLQ